MTISGSLGPGPRGHSSSSFPEKEEEEDGKSPHRGTRLDPTHCSRAFWTILGAGLLPGCCKVVISRLFLVVFLSFI